MSKILMRVTSIVCVLILMIRFLPITLEVNAQTGFINGDFETGNMTGWNIVSGNLTTQPANMDSNELNKQGDYFLSTGKIMDRWSLSNEKLALNQKIGGGDYLALNKTTLPTNDVICEVDVNVVEGNMAGIVVRSDENKWFAYGIFISPGADQVHLIKYPWMGFHSNLTFESFPLDYNTSYHLKVKAFTSGTSVKIQVYINNNQVMDYTDDVDASNPRYHQPSGNYVGITANYSRATFDNLSVQRYDDNTTLLTDNFSSGNLDNYTIWPDNIKIVDDTFIGEIRSDNFTISSNYMSLRVGGQMDLTDEYIALVRESDGTELYKETGGNTEYMTPKIWDVSVYKGESCYIKIVDGSSDSRSHINIDNIRFVDTIPMEVDVSILESQLGYHPEGVKKILLRSAKETPLNNPTGKTFEIRNDSGLTVYTGSVSYWGQKWDSYWWLLDFSDFKTIGTGYKVKVLDAAGNLVSSAFSIEEDVLTGNDNLEKIALEQLDSRKQEGLLGWRDCGSTLREITSEIIAVNALVDIYENKLDNLSPANKTKLVEEIEFGADYILACQQTTSDPMTKGRFVHDLYTSPWSAYDLYTWHDAAVAITALVRAYSVVNKTNPIKAQSYLDAAIKAYDMCVYRQYNLISEIDHGGTGKGLEYQTNSAKMQYYITDKSWTFPTTLGTKDKLNFTWACTLLYRVTSDDKYRDKAAEFADYISERQFTDFMNSIEGAYGHFYEFENSNVAFTKDWTQEYGLMLGNLLPVNLKGIMDLVTIYPSSTSVAKWYNIVKTYGEHYAKKTASLSPFGIYPVSAYKDPSYAGIKFFQTINHGATSLYGMISKNFMEIGDFLNDKSYQELAENNLQFVMGLNPGIPNAYNEQVWDARSLLKGIGVSSFEGFGSLTSPHVGSGSNGFCASNQFIPKNISVVSDAPRGILNPDGTYQFNEDYLPISHAYVSGISKIENHFTLNVVTKNSGVPVSAAVTVELPEAYHFNTDAQGSLIVTSLPKERQGVVKVTYDGRTITRTLDTLSSGTVTWMVDFADYIDIALTVPSSIQTGENKSCTVELTNKGVSTTSAVITLSADGVNLDTTSFDVPINAGETQTRQFTITPGTKTMPYLIHASVSTAYNSNFAIGQGNNSVVKNEMPTGVTLNESTIDMYKGYKKTLFSTVEPLGANPNLSWITSDASVATVDSNGVVTGVREGTATITATTQDGGYSADCQVTVKLIDHDFDTNSFFYDWSQFGGKWEWMETEETLKVSFPEPLSIEGLAINDKMVESDFMYSANVKLQTGNAVGLSFRLDDKGSRGYDVMIDRFDSGGVLKLVSRPYKVLGTYKFNVNLNQNYNIKVFANGSSLKVYLDGIERINITDNQYAKGKFGINAYNSTAIIDNVRAKQRVLEDFNHSNLEKWNSLSGTLTHLGTYAQLVSTMAGGLAVYNDVSWTDIKYSGDITLVSGNAVGLSFRLDDSGSTGYDVIIDQYDGCIKLCKRPYEVVETYNFSVNTGQKYNIAIEANGTNIKVFLDGILRMNVNDDSYSEGKFGMFGYNSTSHYDNLDIALVNTNIPKIFSQDFNSGSLTGWNTIRGLWTNTGSYVQGETDTSGGILLYNEAVNTNFTYSADVKLVSGNAAGIIFRSDNTASTGYAVMIDQYDGGTGRIKLYSLPYTVLGSYYFPVALNTTYTIKVVAEDSTIKVYLNNIERINVKDDKNAVGKFGLTNYNSVSQFDNVAVE